MPKIKISEILTLSLSLLLSLLIVCSCSAPTSAGTGDGTVDQTVGETNDDLTEKSDETDKTDNTEEKELTEMRGVWLASVWNIDYPSKAGLRASELKKEADEIVKTAKEVNLNAVFFQVRPMSDALYKSEIFPYSAWLTGEQGKAPDGGFDPLEYMIKLCHENGIELHAWINPLRITNGTKAAPKTDLTALAENNPARLHPEWVVNYADANLCYDAGLPEVRQLVCDGVKEIIDNYDVDGIIFDDYFYPYAIDNKPFNDDETYAKYGSEYSCVEDFRRDSINKLVKGVYDTVKAKSSELKFGVGPCGIWQNSDGKNGGSPTKGFEAYKSIYCDSLAWIKGGYVDYIAPQLYWACDSTAAPFYPLASWWNRQVKGTNVTLYISQASYRYEEWNKPGEMTKQIENAMRLSEFKGSIFYNYSSIADNLGGIKDELIKLYTSP